MGKLPKKRQSPGGHAKSNSIAFALVGVLSSALAEKLRTTGDLLAQRESDLSKLQALHVAIVRSLPAGLMTVNRNGRIGFANESAQTILGLRWAELAEAEPGRTCASGRPVSTAAGAQPPRSSRNRPPQPLWR